MVVTIARCTVRVGIVEHVVSDSSLPPAQWQTLCGHTAAHMTIRQSMQMLPPGRFCQQCQRQCATWRNEPDAVRPRTTFYLQPARVVTILEGIFQDGETFTCHNAAYGRWHRGTYRPHQRDQHCAGALMLIRREDVSHRVTQIAERLGLYDPGKLDLSAPVFPTVEVMLERFEALELATALLAWLARVRPRPPQ